MLCSVIYLMSFQLVFGFSAEFYPKVNDSLKTDIVSVKLFLKEEEIPRLIVESMFGDDQVLNRHFKDSEIMFSDVAEILLDTFTVNFKQTLKLIEIKCEDIHKLIVWCKSNWKSISTAINVTKIYQILANSHFFLNVNTIQTLSDMPGEVLFDIVNPNATLNDFLKLLISINFQEITIKLNNNKNTKSFITDLKHLIHPTKILKLLKLLNITADNFYRNEAFAKFLKHVLNFKEPVTGTFVSSNKVITFLYDDYLKEYTEMFVETSEASPTRYKVNKVIFDPTNIVILESQELSKQPSIQEPENINSALFTNCMCVRKTSDNILHVEYCNPKLDENNILHVVKQNLNVFNLGSPLICKNYLCGVANFEDENHVEFIPFYSENREHKEL
ncbi:hypothetical protein ILUMI_19926 [Ignelater luminosus]|uniref:Uncharacterized protein n=1 Tax=Ignelater luminosus TaxID=2038154 RepID=A0A8K0CJ70_IGNLU|nr:hypothetical protein ILUMI_19926 [Ignelater luminosus]